MISLDGVSKRFPDGTVAVDELSLTVPTGEVLALLGSSGCGKTTTLRMINRLVEPTGGTISIDGRDVRSLDVLELRRGIGYVIQQAGLFPHRTVVQNVMTVPRLLGWDRRRARARALEMLDLVGLERASADRYPTQLSGGQQQRVGVARALASDPPVLLMDEPFGAVDPIVRTQLQDEFLKLQRELAKTVVFVTHDVDEAIRLASSVAVLRPGGRLAQLGSPAELLLHPADDFVADFLGADRSVKLLGLRRVAELTMRPPGSDLHGWRLDASGTNWCNDAAAMPAATVALDDSARVALDRALGHPVRGVVVVGADGRPVGVLGLDDVAAPT